MHETRSLTYTTMPTPAGPFTMILDPEGAVLASGWTPSVGSLRPLAGLGSVGLDLGVNLVEQADAGAASRAVASYLDGDFAGVASIPVVEPSLGPFIGAAWKLLREIPPGETLSYTGLAEIAGRPSAVRAAAAACARNPVALFVPCHRVLRGDGSPGGFRWGLPAKQWLLDHERQPRT